jgi:hypothetical protein
MFHRNSVTKNALRIMILEEGLMKILKYKTPMLRLELNS